MRIKLLLLLLCGWWLGMAHAQEMQPRAYLPSPVGVGFAGMSWGVNSGGLLFDPSLPIEDANITGQGMSLSVGGVTGWFGRTNQLLAIMPYTVASISARIAEVQEARHFSGLADMTFRYSVNVYNAPAMTRGQLAQHRRNLFVGVSLTATASTGQYDMARRLNIGTNRFAFKPEVGVSKAFGKWAVEGAFGAWMYTKNTKFGGGKIVRTQTPLWSSQAHLVRVVNRRQWLAFDFTYFAGGRVRLDGVSAVPPLFNTRMGGTWGVILPHQQSLRVSFFTGVTTRVGADTTSVAVAYQFLWARGRE